MRVDERRSVRGMVTPVMRAGPDEVGVIAIVTTLAISTVLLGVAALAVDLGQTYLQRNELQMLADRLALAAARGLPQIDTPEGALGQITTTLAAACAHDEEPAQVCAPTRPEQWSDGNPDNGEAVFYAGAAPDGTLSGRLSGTDLPAEAVHVLLPPATVEFGLAGVLGFDSTRIQRSATARIGTALGSGMLPFALSDEDLSAGRFCLVGPQAARSCPADSAPVRPVRLERSDTTDPATALTENIRSGAELATGPVGYDLLDAALDCLTRLLLDHTSCLVEEPAEELTTALPEGLLRPAGNRPGRLIGDTGHGTQSYNGYHVDATDLFADSGLLDPRFSGGSGQPLRTVLANGATARPENRGWITSAALRSRRLAVVPVVGTQPSGSAGLEGPSAVASLRYVWIDSDNSDRGLLWDGGNLVGLEGYLIDPRYFPETTSGSLSVGGYLGPGLPKEAVLLTDSPADVPR